MRKEFFINRNNKQYRVTVTAEDLVPLIYVRVENKRPDFPIPFRWLWWPIGDDYSQSGILNIDETIEAQVNRLIERAFAKAQGEAKEKSELEKYFSKTP